MITPAFSVTATERILPKLALDFTTASLDSRVTFARTTDATHPATYVNSSGVIASASDNQPRFDYDPVALTCKGLLIEESRANLQTYSTITNANWSRVRCTITDNSITSPLGTTTAPRLDCDTTGGGMNASGPQCTIGSGATTTASIFLKKGYDNFALLIVSDGAVSNGVRQYVNINTGVLGSSSVFGTGWAKVSASVSAYANGWYRVVLTVSTTGTTAKATVFPSCPADGNVSCTAGVTYGYPWGAQVEAGAFATSYIPTTSASLTRNADVATMTGSNFSNWYSAGVGGLSVRAVPSTVSGTRPSIQFDDTTANELIVLRGNTTNPELYIVDGGVAQAQIDAGTIAANTAYNLTGAWATNSCAAAVNGGAAVTDTTATMPTVTQARLGCDGTNYLDGWLQSVRYWPQRITDAEAQAFSK